VSGDIRLPEQSFLRRLITGAKRVRWLHRLLKRLNTARNWEIRWILEWARIRPDDRICDVGSGDGYWTNSFHRNARWIVGVDPFIDDVRKAARDYRRESVNFVAGVAEHIPLEDSSVTKVLSVCVFEHCSDDEAAFRECYRILRDGGVLVATVDSLTSPHISERHRAWHCEACYCRQLYTKESLVEKLRRAGFRRVRCRYLVSSRFTVLWEIFSERAGPLHYLFGPLGRVVLPLVERGERDNGYKLLVEATR